MLRYILILLLTFQSFSGLALERVALVIGNSTYNVGYDLGGSPLRDAEEMEQVLRKVGFSVILKKDLTLRGMKKTIGEFSKQLNENTVALFYFSGHGVQYEGENYLIPVGAMESIYAPGHIRSETLGVSYVLDVMAYSKSKVNLVFLDACRNSPVKGLFKGDILSGLAAPSKTPSGTIIAYATKVNEVALTGKIGKTSPYVAALKQEILKKGISILNMLTNVRSKVKQITRGEQAPAFYSELDGLFCFVGPCGYGYPSSFPSLPKPQPSSKTWREPITGMEMVKIKGGCFQMGSPPSEKGHRGNEKQQEICVDDFWMATTEVTNAQYRQFKSEHDSEDYKGHSLNGNNQPAVYVSWHDAMDFVDWLTQQHKGQRTFRLPTEAEWEYAARAGTQTAYYWGDNPDKICEYGNIEDKIAEQAFDWSSDVSCEDGYAVTAPVKSFKPNNFGLYDMLGNVWEWTASGYAFEYNGMESKILRTNNVTSTHHRVLRGGCWLYDARLARSAYRGWNEPIFRNGSRGFRFALGQM